MTALAPMRPDTPTRPTPTDARPGFVMRLAHALHGFGVPAHRLEPVLESVALSLDLQMTCFVEPTAIQASFETEAGPVHRFLRVGTSRDDLGRLAELDSLAAEVANRSIDLPAAEQRLDRILEAPESIAPAVQVLGFGIASACAACLFGGGMPDILAALGIGAAVGTLLRVLAHHDRAAPLQDGLAALFAGVLAHGLLALGLPIRLEQTLIASLIVLLPGLTLTLAVAELATSHLASGVGRLAQSAVSLGGIAFGVVLAGRLTASWTGESIPEPSIDAGAPTVVVALAVLLAPLAFAVLLRAAKRDLVPILGIGILAYLGARFGGLALGPEPGAFVGAFLVAAASNRLAHLRDRPSSVTLVPGILLMVPGSLGLRSLHALMQQHVEQSFAALGGVVTVAFALVSGLLLANWIAPPRRSL